MSKRILEEPIELTDAELEVVSGGAQSPTGDFHEDLHENPNGASHQKEKGGT
jgi:hypothetical protein